MVVVTVPWQYQRYDRKICTIDYPGSTQSTTTITATTIMIMVLLKIHENGTVV
jgi:hypothetical protein